MENYIGKRDEYIHIDIHGTVADSGIFTIVTNPTPQNLVLACSLPIENTVIWEGKYYKEHDGFGAISEFSDCGVAIECGLTIGKTEKEVKPVQEKLYAILRDFVMTYLSGKLIGNVPAQNLWQVDGKYMTSSGLDNLKDFDLYEYEGKTFSPLLAGQYRKNGVYCYTMQPLSLGSAAEPILVRSFAYRDIEDTYRILKSTFTQATVTEKIFSQAEKSSYYTDFVEELDTVSKQISLQEMVRDRLTDPVSRYNIEYSTSDELSLIIKSRIQYQGTHYRFLSPVQNTEFLESLVQDMKNSCGKTSLYTVVDVGCGNGALLDKYSNLFKRDKARLYGVDISSKSATYTASTVPGSETYAGAFTDEGCDVGEASLIFLSYFIDRDQNQMRTLLKAYETLQTGGMVVIEGLFPCVLEDSNGVVYGSANITKGETASEDIVLVVRACEEMGFRLQKIVCGNRFVYSLDGFEDLPSYTLVFTKL